MLEGKHAIVTGGGTGIGLAIARSLADQGAEVTITGRRREVLEEAAGDTLHPLVMDVTDEASVCDGIAQAVEARGPIQICVPNAGVAEGRALHKTDTEFWRWVMATNLDGAFWTIRESLSSMRNADWGRVIAVSSIAGIRGLKGASAYTASKHGLIGLIRSLSEDYLGKPITFNALIHTIRPTASIRARARSAVAVAAADDRRAYSIATSRFADVDRHPVSIMPARPSCACCQNEGSSARPGALYTVDT